MTYRTRLIIAWLVGLGIPATLAIAAFVADDLSGILGLLAVIALIASTKTAHMVMRRLPSRESGHGEKLGSDRDQLGGRPGAG